MKKRYITVPTTIKSMKEFEYGNIIEDEIEEVMLTNDEFDKIWNLGLFENLNTACNAMIDDYEEDTIEIDQLENALEVVTSLNNALFERSELIERIQELIKLAIKCKTCIIFDF